MQEPVQDSDAESNEITRSQKDDCQEDGEEEDKQITKRKAKQSTGTQTNAKENRVLRSSPRLALKINLKYADKMKLQEVFGRTDVKPGDVAGTLLELISRKDPCGIKWLLDLEFKPFEYLPLVTRSNLETYPLVKAMITFSYECLETLLNVGKGMYKQLHIWSSFKVAILRMPLTYPNILLDQLAPGELAPFMRCVKLMLHHGTSVNMCAEDVWELDAVAAQIEKHSKIVTFLFVAGAQFEYDPEDGFIRDQPHLQPTEFTLYIEKKFYPCKDESGYFQPESLQEISRDFVRKFLIHYKSRSNLFVSVPQLPIPKPIKELLLYFQNPDD